MRPIQFVFVVILAFSLTAQAQTQEPANASPASDDGVEVLARGPVHEGFAGPTESKPEAGISVAKQPPNAVEELPPDEKPSEDAVWIPGYWAWDDDSNDFLWVSGIWRVTPPGYQWVSGYWGEADGGWQWVAGFWAPQEQQQAQYLPEPPASLDVGPNTPTASPDSFWVSGYWNYSGSNYAWRPGFWSVAQADWIWVPPYYTWTPSGYVFTGGYWDYPVATRGYLYAPVSFQQTVLTTPGFCYRPAFQVNVGLVLNNLFCRPSARHYYFGDYYGSGYAGRGFVPWYDSRGGRRGYDPLFNYYNWSNSRSNPQWAANLRQDYSRRQQFAAERPPRTFNQQQAFALKAGNQRNVNNIKFQPIVQASASGNKSVIVRSPKEIERARLLRDQAQTARGERAKIEKLSPDQRQLLTQGKNKVPRQLQLPKNSVVEGYTTTKLRDGKARDDRGRLDGATIRKENLNNGKGLDAALNNGRDGKGTAKSGQASGNKPSSLGQNANPRSDFLNNRQNKPVLDKLPNNNNAGKNVKTPDVTGRVPQLRPTPDNLGKTNKIPNGNLNDGRGKTPVVGSNGGTSNQFQTLDPKRLQQTQRMPNINPNKGQAIGPPQGAAGGTKLYPPAQRSQPPQPKEFKHQNQQPKQTQIQAPKSTAGQPPAQQKGKPPELRGKAPQEKKR